MVGGGRAGAEAEYCGNSRRGGEKRARRRVAGAVSWRERGGREFPGISSARGERLFRNRRRGGFRGAGSGGGPVPPGWGRARAGGRSAGVRGSGGGVRGEGAE
ncbi:hypothetical protein GCM10027168_52320 [Streptomyces capparidis]